MQELCATRPPPPSLCQATPLPQATRGSGSLVTPRIWALHLCLSSKTVLFYLKAGDLGTMAFVAYLAPWVSEWCTMSFRMCHAPFNA